jgi:hypothetical protein
MRKYTANYLISDNGIFLKNGIMVAEENGTVVQYIDTTDDLKEIALLSFHNGILMPGCMFLKSNAPIPAPESYHPIFKLVMNLTKERSLLSIQNLIDLVKNVQEKFPEMKIPEIMNKTQDILLSNSGFIKENIPGIFLLTGVDLPQLHFTQKTRIKRIL